MTNRIMSEEVRERAATLFTAMSHPARVQMVELVKENPLSVGQIASQLGLSQSGVSQHLAILARAGVLVSERRGTAHLYKARGPRIGAILDLIEEFCGVHALSGGVDSDPESNL